MDPITHISQKILAERARQAPQQQQRSTLPETAPPPYTTSDSDDESDDEQEDEPPSPLKLTINAAHSIQGSNNLIPTSPTALADATKFSTILLHAVNQINHATDNQDSKSRRSIKVDLTINCGITVIGDRNVIGNVGLKPKALPNGADTVLGSGVVAGVKRKAEDDSEDEQAPKRPAIEGASP